MRHRSHSAETPAAAAPTCWQREAPSVCLRVELPTGEAHLFSYQHFVTASLKRNDTGAESMRIAFTTHEVEVEGRGLRELLFGLQDFAVKWLKTTPDRYHALPAGTDGVVTAIRIAAVD